MRSLREVAMKQEEQSRQALQVIFSQLFIISKLQSS